MSYETCRICGKPPARYPNWILSNGYGYHVGCVMDTFEDLELGLREIQDELATAEYSALNNTILEKAQCALENIRTGPTKEYIERHEALASHDFEKLDALHDLTPTPPPPSRQETR